MVFFLFWVVKYFPLLSHLFFLLSYLFAWLSFVKNPQLLQVLFTNSRGINFNLDFLLLNNFWVLNFFALIFSLLFTFMISISVCLNCNFIILISWLLAITLNEWIWFEYFSLYFYCFRHTLVGFHFLFNKRFDFNFFQWIDSGFMLFGDHFHTVWERSLNFFFFQLFFINFDHIFLVIDILMELSME